MMLLKDLLDIVNVNVVLMYDSSEMAIVKPMYTEILAEKVLNATVKKIDIRTDMIRVWLEE